MASIALRYKCHSLNPKPRQNLLNFSHLYSSSSSRNDDNGGNGPPKPPIFSSYFNHQHQQQQQQQQSSSEFRATLDKLSEFRRRTSSETPFPANSNTQNPNLFPNQYNKSAGNPNPSFREGGFGNLSYDLIKESLQKIKRKVPVQPNNNNNNNNNNKNNENVVPGKLSLSTLKESFKMKPSVGRVLGKNDGNVNESNDGVDKRRVISGLLENLSSAAFKREIKENEVKKARENDVAKFDLIKTYSHEELGVRLRDLRPDTSTLVKNKKGKEGEVVEGWFSLSELQQRLGKLRELEEKESAVGKGGVLIGDLRKDFQVPQGNEIVENLKIDLLSHFKSHPKEHLVEKYFHPDNMSAAEKLKLELKKVRDEFKMSESDCGSTRVQIAQLTTEILHLSSMLHKKDKHSRRGLQAKVQQRKKLLKYLRRTDWDSYCFVLSKLGLRDNPDYKN